MNFDEIDDLSVDEINELFEDVAGNSAEDKLALTCSFYGAYDVRDFCDSFRRSYPSARCDDINYWRHFTVSAYYGFDPYAWSESNCTLRSRDICKHGLIHTEIYNNANISTDYSYTYIDCMHAQHGFLVNGTLTRNTHTICHGLGGVVPYRNYDGISETCWCRSTGETLGNSKDYPESRILPTKDVRQVIY